MSTFFAYHYYYISRIQWTRAAQVANLLCDYWNTFFLMTRSHLNLPIGQMNDFLSEKQADKNELVAEPKYDKVST